MATQTIIIGESGSGKTSSLRNLNPLDCLLIQAERKQLPFKNGKTWKVFGADTKDKCAVMVSDNGQSIVKAMKKTDRKIIIVDDFQYVMANEFMRRVTESDVGNSVFQKYNEIAFNAWSILKAANELPDDVRVYILTHSQTDDFGTTKIKTLGKLLDDKIVLEGMVPIVLKTEIVERRNVFRTVNSGRDTVKTPMGMFNDEYIDNDLKIVDNAILQYI